MAKAHSDVTIAALPGNYEPATVKPTARPSVSVGNGGNNSQNQQVATQAQVNQPKRKSLAEINQNRPSVGVGEVQQRGKPKTILDLIFGG